MARIINKRNTKKKAAYYGKFVNLYKGGYSVTQITKMLPVTYVTLYNWLHEAIAKGELVKGEAASIPAISPSDSDIPQNAPAQTTPIGVYLAKEPPAAVKLTGLPQLAEEVARIISKPAR